MKQKILILQVKDFSWLYFYSNTAELSNVVVCSLMPIVLSILSALCSDAASVLPEDGASLCAQLAQ